MPRRKLNPFVISLKVTWTFTTACDRINRKTITRLERPLISGLSQPAQSSARSSWVDCSSTTTAKQPEHLSLFSFQNIYSDTLIYTMPLVFPVEPMLLKSAKQLPAGIGSSFEPNLEGFRALLFIERGYDSSRHSDRVRELTGIYNSCVKQWKSIPNSP